MFDYYNPIGNLGSPSQNLRDYQFTMAGFRPRGGQQPVAPVAQQQQQANTGMYGDPFGTAMSGGKSGTLQPYINRMTQNSSNALYGGLLDYQPQSMIAGDAGGTPVNSQVPDWMLSGGLLGSGQIGQRAWMGKQNGAT